MSARPYRVLVTGSRDWEIRAQVNVALNRIRDFEIPKAQRLVVVHGDCPTGADRLASQWAYGAVFTGDNVTEEKHPANWQLNGKRAGFIRNAQMVNLGADICLAFIKDGSRGASHTARLAEEAGIPTRRWTA